MLITQVSIGFQTYGNKGYYKASTNNYLLSPRISLWYIRADPLDLPERKHIVHNLFRMLKNESTSLEFTKNIFMTFLKL